MMHKLAYGKTYINVEIPDENLVATLLPHNFVVPEDGREMIKKALDNPLACEKIASIIENKGAKNAVIVVNDITRPTPYDLILPPLLEQIESAGIEAENIVLLIATGIHRHHSREDNLSVFGEDICNKYKIQNHDCDDNLLSIGKLADGTELIINRTAAQADLLITTGVVGLHYFAGYSGGRKSILPGIAARQLIEANHKMMNDTRARLGNYEDNPVSNIMLEAARMAGVDFIVNVVTHSKTEIAYCAAGDLYEAWMAAVKFCEQMDVLDIKQKADIVVAGCGGYPKDINMYQAQKALDAAVLAVKPGGTIILAAECIEGLGEETFQDWIENASCPQDIINRFHSKFELGGHKAFAICRILEKADIQLLSGLTDETVRNMFLNPVHNINEAIQIGLNKYGNSASILFIPQASKIGIKLME